MEMRLLKMKLRNFKGIRDFTLDCPGGGNVTIYGQNKAGKTSIADAISWLLFSRDSRGQAQFEIKTLDQTGEALHNLEHEVEAVFLGEKQVTLKKVFSEKYTKKRGSLTADFTGHQTDHYVDDVPVTMAQYKTKVAEISITDDRFSLLTNPNAFVSLHWKDQRQLLLDICGDVRDADIIAVNPDLAQLPAILDGKSCDDRKKIVMGQRKKINEEITGIPGLIDELSRNLPELTTSNTALLINNLTKLRGQLETKNTAIAQAQAGGGVAELRTNITEINGKIKDIENRLISTRAVAIQGMRDDLSAKKDELADLRRNLKNAESNIGIAQADLAHSAETKASLIEKYGEIKASCFAAGACQHCGALPEHQPEAEGLQAKFNETRAKLLEDNIAKGKATAAIMVSLVSEIKELGGIIARFQLSIGESEKAIAKIENDIATTPAVNVDLNTDAQALVNERTAIEKQIEAISNGGDNSVLNGLNIEKETINAEIAKNESLLAAIEQSQNIHTRITELKADEKRLAAEYAKLEGHLFLIERFETLRSEALSEKVNGKFRVVSFKLFNSQVNGGIEPCCEATINGVPYSSANSAARVQAGLSIISVLSDYYEFHPVVFIDNRESVTEIPELKAQVISLVVFPGWPIYDDLHKEIIGFVPCNELVVCSGGEKQPQLPEDWEDMVIPYTGKDLVEAVPVALAA